MKKGVPLFAAILLLFLLGTWSAFTQEKEESKRLEIVFGPRVGVNYIVVDPEDYNAAIQKVFPDPDRRYFPILTLFGLNLEQRIRLGNTQSHFAFQEVLTVGGLDQNIIVPGLAVLIGFRSRMGLEVGLGPIANLKITTEGVGIGISVVYSVGWTFSFEDVFVPVDLALVPTPSDGNPRISLLTGFNFKTR
jgi:hypothetical protein